MTESIDLTPEEFEEHVENLLKGSGLGLAEFRVARLEKLPGFGGSYEIDVTARFEALGVEFLVLVECKHHRTTVWREMVQTLHDKIRAVGAHKGIMFATGGFQSGAKEYARAHGIALIHVKRGRPTCIQKGYGVPAQPRLPQAPSVGWLVWIDPDGHEQHVPLWKETGSALLAILAQG